MKQLTNKINGSFKSRTHRVLTGAACTIAGFIAIALLACSDTVEPQTQGTISLVLNIETPDAGPNLSPAQTVLDSVVVRVFRGGTGVVPETSQGVAINGANSVDVTISCIAETDKKVSVELFRDQRMYYFGIDEHVDVVENENTNLMIEARDFFVDRVDVTPQSVVEGTAYNVTWTATVAAVSYLVVESTKSDFAKSFSQTYLTTDTVMTFQRGPGAYYYAIAPLNPYAAGTSSDVAYGYVQTVGELPPQITGAGPLHAAIGETVTIQGSNLDVPGRVLLGGVECPIVSATHSELVFAVAPEARTGQITLQTLMGTVIPNPAITIAVDRIAYVTVASGDQHGYVQMIRNETSIASGVAVVPVDELADREMRIFDIIIVSNEVADGWQGTGNAAVEAIAGSDASVLAIGRGGQAYMSLVFDEIGGGAIPAAIYDRALHVLRPTPVFESPVYIPQVGAYVEISSAQQVFSSYDFDGISPASITAYASLAGSQNNVVLFDIEGTDAMTRPIHNFFWGCQGDPYDLYQDSGRQLLINVLNYLEGETKAATAGTAFAGP
jgi:hypothetical protein